MTLEIHTPVVEYRVQVRIAGRRRYTTLVTGATHVPVAAKSDGRRYDIDDADIVLTTPTAIAHSILRGLKP